MTGPSSTPRGEHPGRPGTTWNTQLAHTETVIDDDTPDPTPPNRATRRAIQRASRKRKRSPMPDLHAWITQQVDETEAYARDHILDPTNALRRCEADRRILARHTLDPEVHYEPACKGCGTYGDMELPETDNLNECPELLDLAHAHGLTPEILATLDQPIPPPRPERPEPRVTNLTALMKAMTVRPTSSVPAALRGPNWKGRPNA